MPKHTLSRREQQKRIEGLTKCTKFRSKFEVECLLREFKKHSMKGKIDKQTFRTFLHNVFHVTDDILMERIFKAFATKNNNSLDEEEWVKGMSIYLRGDNTEKIKFCFGIYDMNSDNFITKEDMMHLLKHAFVTRGLQEEDPEDTIKELFDLVLKLLDTDTDGRISFHDFEAAVMKDPHKLLLEALGIVLPDQNKVQQFESSLTADM